MPEAATPTRSRLVAAVVPTISGPVFLETVQSLTEALAERGYQMMLGQVSTYRLGVEVRNR
jgi:DNA-binding LacI/PurR family transcriptional regulator